MSDPGKIIVALSFCASITYIVRLLVLHAPWPRFGDARSATSLAADDDRMARLEQAVESIAIEVERISEGQRFTTKLLSERVQADEARMGQSPVFDRRVEQGR